MLHTWKRDVWIYDVDLEDDRHEQIETGGIVTPDCCEAAQNSFVVRLAYRWDDLREERIGDAAPAWCISLPFELLHRARKDTTLDLPAPTVCPYCATPLPEIKRREGFTRSVYTPVGDGDYCGSCKERSRACMCFYPEARWMVA